ncbi:MAG: UvrB/UvrC motif-containing protein [Clostridia bacterium]|nr:UvrB/UvrC motif-containing protein [Clostridia bacterium]
MGARQLAVWQTKERPQHASKLLEFEHAAILRDRIKELQQTK